MIGNARQFYQKLLEYFPREMLSFSLFVDPSLNHKDFPEIQFVFPNGAIIPPWNTKATDILDADPLQGPFYALPVIGLIFRNSENPQGWYYISLVVKLDEVNLSHSSVIGICGVWEEIRKVISPFVKNKWYIAESINGQWRYTLDDREFLQNIRI